MSNRRLYYTKHRLLCRPFELEVRHAAKQPVEAGYAAEGLGEAAATERADVRSWLTLPDSWHGARLFLAPGVHELALEAAGGQGTGLGTYELEPGETLVVIARTLGTRLYAYPIGGRRVDLPSKLPQRGVPGREKIP